MNQKTPGQLMTRREMQKRMLLGAAGLAAAHHMPAFAQPATPVATAKAVIQIWMWGGPPHIDTFDPKPDAGYDYCGPFNRPIDTNVPGMQIGQLLPQLAQQADKYSIIRSMTHGNNGHETASYIVQTGHKPGGRLVFPSLGAIVSKFKGYDTGYSSLIPPYVVLTQSQGRFDPAGFFGPRYKPFVTGGDPNASRFAVEGVVSGNISDERQKSRRELLHSLDSLKQALPEHPVSMKLGSLEDKAYEMILGDAGKLFDLSTEDNELRQRYGRNRFGQSCLMARRLVGAGVPFVTINYGGWDTHKQHFQSMRTKLPQMDAAMATLLQDLKDHGLLDSTIVWWSGEFGRTPKVAWPAPWNGGRHHFGQCFSALLAGGGFKGGKVIGASDATGEKVAERPVYPPDLLGSICERMGINPDESLPNRRGMELKVMASGEEFGEGGGRLTEIV
ncbi:MAG: DUF1501 domain-containing protein [Kiritimatiellia bacterium]|nr:DUF1501 domain-containing protein [Kiritimatiellia bacterium]